MARRRSQGPPDAAVDGIPEHVLRYDRTKWPDHRLWVAARVAWGRTRGWTVAETNATIRAAGGDGFYDHLRVQPEPGTP